MLPKILLTSFQTWLGHQKSNSSDDLLAVIQERHFPNVSLSFLRQLPVDVAPASQQAIGRIRDLQPDAVICCGMAAGRQLLTVESSATLKDNTLHTQVDLEQLVAGLSRTKISHDAGKFVCEGLYYHVLSYLQESSSSNPCIFVHVPLLNGDNLASITRDMGLIIARIGQQVF